MNFEQLRKFSPELMRIAKKYGISQIYVFGSVARGDPILPHDVDLLVEMQAGRALFGVAGFGYDCEKLLGVQVDVVPMSTLPTLQDREFVKNIQKDAVLL
jgi:predicted nucleotidyltransferase